MGADGTVVIIDEWDEAGNFEKFFDDPAIAELLAQSGVEGPPEILIVEALETADQF
jgi:hypothetical protein